MIRDQWYVVLESREVGEAPAGFLRLGERMVFWRDGAGRVVCHVDKCAHRGASLALGDVMGEGADKRLRCPFHGLEYDPTGRCALIPANGRGAPVPDGFELSTYPTRESRGFVWIWWGEGEPEGEPRFFEDIGLELSYSTFQDPWDNHYGRSIENQLDVAHLPFVHRTTIGRGNRTLVEGPGVMKVEDGLLVYVFNKADDGSRPRRGDELIVPPPGREQKLEFLFPNLWQNYITARLRVLAAFVPVAEDRTIAYFRFYQSFVRIPILRGIVNALGDRMNAVIAHQDRRIVNTQVPKADATGCGELLFPGDSAIMEYRKMVIAAKRKAAEAAKRKAEAASAAPAAESAAPAQGER
jgi:phenylpropionate dioxygenase-like ring-hydroxylating dioxygenase large terminal subunit